MPFDALTRSPHTLADAAFELGITPVPAEVLAAHKQTEQAKYPPGSVLYPYVTHLRVGIALVSMVGLAIGLIGVVSMVRTMVHPTPENVLTMGGLCGVSFVLLLTAMWWSAQMVRGPAEWVEYLPTSLLHNDAPEPMLTVALHLICRTPGAKLVIGELRQNNVVLDPYMVVRTPTEEVCLAIWDDASIHHQAQVARNLTSLRHHWD